MMNSSATIGAIAKALSAAQGELKNPAKDKVATIESNKGRFKYSYTDFAGALDQIRAVLSKHGLAFTQNPYVVEGNYVMLDSRVLHESGEWIGNIYPVGLVADHRTLGSAMSYARRHAGFPLLGIQGEDEDDDAEPVAPAQRHAPPPPPDVESIADTYIKRFNEAETAEAFEDWVTKARAALGRMTADDKKRISASVEARRLYWTNQAFEGAEVVEPK
jgi:hypothetical protein